MQMYVFVQRPFAMHFHSFSLISLARSESSNLPTAAPHLLWAGQQATNV